MGASESSAPPASQQGQATPNENREPAAPQSEFDPRSPSSNVERTPVRMKVSAAHVPPDPRSPTFDFQRTPLRGVKDKSENSGHVLFPDKEKEQAN